MKLNILIAASVLLLLWSMAPLLPFIAALIGAVLFIGCFARML